MNRQCVFALFSLLFTTSVYAEVYVPKELEPWRQWVLERDANHQQRACPFLFNKEQRFCVWPNSLSVQANNNGGAFTLKTTLYTPSWVSLPGSARNWPIEVKRNEKVLPLRGKKTPEVYLDAGTHRISGKWQWSVMPDTLPLPQALGLVTLSINGKSSTTQRDDKGNLWLRTKTVAKASAKQDAEQVRVYRHISDELPLIMTTQIQLDVSGSTRELVMGPALPKGFELININSPLPIRIEQDGNVRVQAKPGNWQLEIKSRALSGDIRELSIAKPHGSWPEQEVWVYQAQRQLRQTRISGTPTVDPSQTRLPAKWKNLPAYAMTNTTRFTIIEQQRGDATPAANALSLSRQMWLSFDGQRFTQQDHITGTLHQGWRLSLQPEYTLGRATVDDQPQLITRRENAAGDGVELRASPLNMNALSEVARQIQLPVSGWTEDFDQMDASLQLPPGWSLLAVSGVDKASGAWLGKWTLWDIFLVMIIAVAIGRLYSWPIGALAALTLALVFHRANAPIFIWLNLVIVLGLLTLAQDPLKRWLIRYQYLSFGILILILLPFMAQELKLAVYPQFEHPGAHMSVSERTPVYETEQDLSMELEEEIAVASSSKMQRSIAYAAPSLAQLSPKPRYRIDPNAIIQTGPGIPQWQWQRINLSWNGPVSANDTLSLYIAPPWLTRIGHIFGVLLCITLAIALAKKAGVTAAVGKIKQQLNPSISTVALLMIGLLSAALPTDSAHAQIDSSILDELHQRLTKAPECLPSCASISRAHLEVKPAFLVMDLVIDALDSIAVPLPVGGTGWQPEQVKINGRSATLTRNKKGLLVIALPAGRHQVRLSGSMSQEQIDLSFELDVNNLSYTVKGWKLSGVVNGRVPRKTLQLSALTKSNSAQPSLRPNAITPFVKVERRFNLGLDWTVTTRVERIAPRSGQIQIGIPLIDGEQPTSPGITQKGSKVIAVLGKSQQQMSWTSNLSKAKALTLSSPETFDWVEVWIVDAAPLWHMSYEGLAPVKAGSAARYQPQWRPRPGEFVTITTSRPAPSPGSSLTINSVFIDHTLGLHNQMTELSFSTISSIGQEYRFSPPLGVTVSEILIDDIAQALNPENDDIVLPLSPAEQQIRIRWRYNKGATIVSEIPAIDFGQRVSNITSRMALPENRWPLLVGGPTLGPAVMWWSTLLVVIALAILLGFWKGIPLGRHDWILLGIGTASVSIFIPVLFVVWLAALSCRPAFAPKLKKNYFRLTQVGLIILGIIALTSLLITIPSGLLSRPDMHVMGNHSSAYALKWFQDSSAAAITQGWLFSLPIWAYQLAMLAWSLWLATVLIPWLKWAWTQLNKGGFWQPEQKSD